MAQNNIALSVPRHRLAVLSKIRQSTLTISSLAQQAIAESKDKKRERQRRNSTGPRDKRAFSLSPSLPFALFLLLSLSLFSLKEKDERRTREGEDKKRNAKERAVLFFSFSFLRVSVLPVAANERHLLSLPLRNAPTCRSRVSSLLLSLEISPGPATRQYPSPNSKEITLGAASCRCGRGEKRTKEDALLGASIFGQWRRTTSRSQYPATGFLSSKKKSSVADDSTWLSTSSKSRER